jgi:hypothetical protein
MRLSAALLQTTFAQTQLSVDADLVLMQEWAAKFHVHASQQADHGCSLLSSSMCVFFCGHGGLDLLYLSSRYEKGKRAVAELMEERHSGVSYRQLNLAHGEIVSKQAALGRSTFPG